MRLARSALFLMVLAASAPAQQIARARTGFAAASLARPDTDSVRSAGRIREPQRLLSGFLLGISSAIGGLAVQNCFDLEHGCTDDRIVTTVLTGYLAGVTLGSAAIPSAKCGFPERVARALAGVIPGAFVSVFLTRMATFFQSETPGAMAVVILAAPVVGASWALKRCD